MDVTIEKGTRVSVRRFVVIPRPYSISGTQLKVLGELETFEGVVTHIRGDDPTQPTKISLLVKKDDGTEVNVDPKHVVGVV